MFFSEKGLQEEGEAPGKDVFCCHHVVNTESNNKPSPGAFGSLGNLGSWINTKKGHSAHIFSISSFSSSAPARSRLFPRTKTYTGRKPRRVSLHRTGPSLDSTPWDCGPAPSPTAPSPADRDALQLRLI